MRLSKAMLDMKNMCIYFISSLKQSYGRIHGQNMIIKNTDWPIGLWYFDAIVYSMDGRGRKFLVLNFTFLLRYVSVKAWRVKLPPVWLSR